ncbi:MAG TPA: LptA/OstA family protein [Sphingobacteriaceae bacterium]
MKSVMLLFFVLMISGALAQEQKRPVGSDGFKINSADKLKGDSVTGSLRFSGNVHFESEKLQLQADEVSVDRKTNTIVATGLKKMTFNGRVVFKAESVHHTLRYRLGEDDVFIE